MLVRRLGFVALAFLGCHRGAPSRPDASRVSRSEPAAVVTTAPPENLLVLVRGASLRRAVPLLFPQGGVTEVLEQLSRQVTPGIADHGDEIDPDAPFAAAGVVTGTEQSTLTLYIAWPLRPGMQIAQDARSQRGWRKVTDGLYAPTAPDAGADAEHQCWVGQREPVGWMLLCGPREGMQRVAGFLREQANTAPDGAPVLDLDVRAELAGRLARRQLAQLDRSAPPRADGGLEAIRRAMFEEARRGAALFAAIASDVERLHGTITQDDQAMHLRAELVLSRATSDTTRALIRASVERQAPTALVQALPATVQAWIVGGFDRAQVLSVVGPSRLDPAIAMQAGPELARVMSAIEEIKSLTPLGERIDAWSPEDGYTMYHIVRRPDAAQFVNDLRVAINSIPNRPLPEGGTLRDLATVLPTPGLTGTHVLRVGRNVRVPPGVQLPPEVRAMVERSMLLVADGDSLIAVMGRDPIARYRAMSQGPRLTATIPANAVLAGRITPPSFAPMFYGSNIPGLAESRTTDGIDFSLLVERRGDGARLELRADAPIGAAMEIRTIHAMIQELQARMLEQMMQQAQQGRASGTQGGARPPSGTRPRYQPPLDPSMLPEPPRLQLQPPQ